MGKKARTIRERLMELGRAPRASKPPKLNWQRVKVEVVSEFSSGFWITACGRQYEWSGSGKTGPGNQRKAEAHYERHARRCAKCRKAEAQSKRETEKLRKAGKLFDVEAYRKALASPSGE